MKELDFSKKFMELYEQEHSKLPYHINLLDIVGANEPKHSRILMWLFRYKSHDGEHAILKSFFYYIADKHKRQWDIDIVNPVIGAEQSNIDLWVREPKKYSVIFENKIHNACDQPNQIARYIEKSIVAGFIEEKIYVLYLTRDCSKKPTENTWQNEDGDNYREDFAYRYLNISWRNDILPWLSAELSKCSTKDNYLRQTIEHYIDHLEGIFNLRKIEKPMNESLQTFIRSELELTSDNHRKNLEKLQEKREDFNRIISQISLMEVDERQKCIPLYLQEWAELMKQDFQQEPKIDKVNNTVYFSIEKDGKSFALQITMESGNSPCAYCGVTEGDDEISEWLKKLGIREGLYNDPDFNVLIYGDTETIYDKFSELAKKILK